MQRAYGDDALEHIGLALGIGLMEHALVARAGRAGLVGIYPGDDVDLVGYLVLHLAQAGDIVDNAVLLIGGAGADDEQQTIVAAGEDILDLAVALLYQRAQLVVEGIHLLEFHRYSELALEFHIHVHTVTFRIIC